MYDPAGSGSGQVTPTQQWGKENIFPCTVLVLQSSLFYLVITEPVEKGNYFATKRGIYAAVYTVHCTLAMYSIMFFMSYLLCVE